MKKYYDVHVFYSRKNGFSIPVEIETDKELSGEEVIQYCVNNQKLDDEDAKQVDSIEEIEIDEYNQMKGI